MENNFNLRKFLTENKLTSNARLIKENAVIDGKKVDINSIEIENISRNDFPDFVDAYAVAASFEDGTELSEDQLEMLNTEYYDVINDAIHQRQLYTENKPTLKNKEVKEGGYDSTEAIGDLYQAAIEDYLGISDKSYKDNKELYDKSMEIYDAMYDADLMDSTDSAFIDKQVEDFIKANMPELAENRGLSEREKTLKEEIVKILSEASYFDSYDSKAAKEVGKQLSSIVDIFSKSAQDEEDEIMDAIAKAEQQTGTEVSRHEKQMLLKHAGWIRTRAYQMER